MKHILILSALLFITAGCGAGSGFQVSALNSQPDLAAPTSNASYELYSWNNNINWGFALFETATRISSYAEITNSPDTIIGLEPMLEKLTELPKGTKVYWNLKRINGFSLPDQKTIEKVQSAAKKNFIHLEVIAWPG